METLAPLDQLIRIRENRLKLLFKALELCQADRVSFERLFKVVNGLSESYRTRGWELFEADLDLLADHDRLALHDGDVIVKAAPEYAGASPAS